VAYPTPLAIASMIHGRHKGVSLNFQMKKPTAMSPTTALIIFGSIKIFAQKKSVNQ
jgi:hypothetical protein